MSHMHAWHACALCQAHNAGGSLPPTLWALSIPWLTSSCTSDWIAQLKPTVTCRINYWMVELSISNEILDLSGLWATHALSLTACRLCASCITRLVQNFVPVKHGGATFTETCT